MSIILVMSQMSLKEKIPRYIFSNLTVAHSLTYFSNFQYLPQSYEVDAYSGRTDVPEESSQKVDRDLLKAPTRESRSSDQQFRVRVSSSSFFLFCFGSVI